MSVVLDSSALSALVQSEPGADVVAEAIESDAVMSAVNFSEVLAKLADRGYAWDAAEEELSELNLTVETFDTD